MSDELERVVNWLLSKQSMSPKKLQKLLYYAQAWSVTLLNEKSDEINNQLFPEDFEAWVHGPVVPEVYREFKEYGYRDIPKKDAKVNLNEDVEDVLNQIMKIYGDFSGNELENISHQEEPWKATRGNTNPLERCNDVITLKSMHDYYIQRVG